MITVPDFAPLTVFPKLQTKRLSLVPITMKHLEDIFALFSDEHVTRFYNLHTFKQLQDAQPFIEFYIKKFNEKSGIRWGITLEDSPQIIGTIGFNNFTKNHRANIGYDLQSKYWNKGILTEALQRVVNFGFEHLAVNRIEAEVMIGNLASEKVLLKNGFTREAVLHDWMLFNNQHYDMTMFSLLKSQYLANQA
ncbi:ribosomal-protein-alanine N-acetyltransferase [Chitinophaga skermanii]|uniref:Ribosomal-protein-alanine N-acetyltransferase n=1 Tax=Chitinophaga skermanii TaxID=331697 RepID=A0A327Q4N5_9BACT|nr:GNAT family N-acetyltransferase [Chitinophaga skermanii]RAI99379.1 ribosomal-protein-alanine N-acetyltransferase [Chitinophaga skermanii]